MIVARHLAAEQAAIEKPETERDACASIRYNPDRHFAKRKQSLILAAIWLTGEFDKVNPFWHMSIYFLRCQVHYLRIFALSLIIETS